MKKKLVCVWAAVAMMAVSACGSGESSKDANASGAETTVAETTKADTSKEETTKEETTEEETTEAEKTDSKFQTGEWDGMVFTNPWFNVEITFPDDCYVYTEEDMQQVLGAGQEVLVNSGNYTDTQMKLADALTVYDFMVALPDGQSSVQLAYENVRLTTGGKGITPEDYLDAVKQQLASIADMGYEFGEQEELEIAGHTFVKLPASVMDGVMYQEYYSTYVDGRMCTMTFSYLPDMKDTVDEIVAGITQAK